MVRPRKKTSACGTFGHRRRRRLAGKLGEYDILHGKESPGSHLLGVSALQRCRVLIASLLLLLGADALAADVAALYEAAVSPSTDRARDSAFIEAFRMVAVKVSGVRSAADKFPGDIPNIRNNVQLRAVRPDGAVTIRFDDAWVDRTLTSAGLPLWGRERPAVLVWLLVPDAAGRPVWMSGDRTSPERDSIERIAQARGLPLVWPAMDVADTATANNLTTTARGSSQALLASGERYRADAVLLGVGSRDASGAVTVRWSFALQGANDGPLGETQASVEEGVEQAADRCAQIFAVVANSRSDVSVVVSGVQTLDAYASTMTYLQGLTVVLGVSVEQLGADSLRLKVAVRGDASTLRRAVDLKRRAAALGPDANAGPPGDTAVRFRYLQ